MPNHTALILDPDRATRTSIMGQLTSDGMTTVACASAQMLRKELIEREAEICLIGARTRSVMRRTIIRGLEQADMPRPLPEQYLRRLGDLEICGISRSVSRRGERVALTTLEFDVLLVLSSKANSVLSRGRIIEAVHGRGWVANDRIVDGIISRLRRKLFDGDQGSERIKTVHRRGYMLIDDVPRND